MLRKENAHLPFLKVRKQTPAKTMESHVENSQKLKMNLQYNPVIPLLGIYPMNSTNS